MITVTKLRTLHPWVRVGVVVFKNDSIGIDRRGEPLRVDHDVVVTGIIPEGDGPLVAFRPYAEHALYSYDANQSASGNVKRNVAPRPGPSLLASIRPP